MLELKKAAIEATEGGRISDARPLWLRLCEVEPQDNDNWLFLSKIDARLGFTSSARGHLNYPMNRGEFDRDVWEQAAHLSFELGHFEEALRLMHRVLASDFSHVDTRLQIAEWCLVIEKHSTALLHCCYSLRAEPSNPGALSGLLYCLLANEDQDAIQSITANVERYTELMTQDICDSTVAKWQSLNAPEKWGSLDRRRLTLAPEIQKRVTTSISASSVDASAYYSSTAHVRAHTLDSENTNDNQSINQCFSELTSTPTSIIELGASVGDLGKNLRKGVAAHTSISGVYLIDEEQAFLSKNTAYDLVLSLDESLTLLPTGHSDVVIINQQAIRLLDQQSIDQLLQQLAPKVVIAIKPTELELPNSLNSTLTYSRELNKSLTIYSNCSIASNSPSNETIAVAADSHIQDIVKALQAVRTGKFDDAVKLVEKFDARWDSRSSVQYLRGIVAQHQKDYSKAAWHLLSCLRRDSQYADGWFQLATVWQSMGKERSMLRAYRKVLEIKPDQQLAAKNLIAFHQQSSNYDRIGIILQQLILKNPIDTNLRTYARNIVASSGKPDFAAWLQQLYQREPFLRAAFEASLQAKLFDRARKILTSLKNLIPDDQAKMLAISLSEKAGDFSDALTRIETLITSDSENHGHQSRRRSMLMATGRHSDALESWRSEVAHFKASNSGFSGALFVGNYFADIPAQELADCHKDWGVKLALEHQESIDKSKLKTLSPMSVKRAKIRVGYISGDFKTHSVSMFLYNFYLHHDRERFEIYSYSTNRANDIWALKYELLSDQWRDVSKLEKVQLVNRIRSDELDILVDLSGHTGHHRLEAMALRCAPIQGTYLGYANTTGLDAVDFRLSDEIADPPNQPKALHTENIEHIDGGFLSYRREFSSPPVVIQRSHSSTKQRHYTYVCCNNIFKITPQAITLFSEILRRNTSANMLIKAHNLDNADLRKNLHELFEANGVTQDRVHLMNALDLDDHQALYNNTDVALDPFPYNGTTTTCDVLWMGVPMIALRGDRHSARVGASILTTVDREEWIAESHEEYVDKAVKLAQDKPRLLEERINLRQDMLRSPLMQPTHTIEQVEKIYTKLVH